MKSLSFIFGCLFAGMLSLPGCTWRPEETANLRPLADTVGFAHLDWQMDSLMARIERQDKEKASYHYAGAPKVVVCPHDDYTYVGSLYPAALQNLSARTIIL